MGSGASATAPDDEDEIEHDGGVIKQIPVEVKAKGRLGRRKTTGSFGKSRRSGGSFSLSAFWQNGSFRSTASGDIIEIPEVEKLKKELEIFKLTKESEIASIEKRNRKLELENRRLRGELQALHKTCAKLRQERDSATLREQQALVRASAFETDRDQIRKNFKMFRETKETELQTLLKKTAQLEAKLTNGSVEDFRKFGNSCGSTDFEALADATQETRFDDLSSTGLDDWPTFVAEWTLPFDISLASTVRVFVSYSAETKQTLDALGPYFKDIGKICERNGRVFVQTSFEEGSLSNASKGFELQRSFMFIGLYSKASPDVRAVEALEGKIKAVFCGLTKPKCSVPVAFFEIDSDEVAELVATEVKDCLSSHLGISSSKNVDEPVELIDPYHIRSLSDVRVYDPFYDVKHSELLAYYQTQPCSIERDDIHGKLDTLLSTAGPVPPLLLLTETGRGCSSLLAQWISNQRDTLMLYHFVDSHDRSSQDPDLILTRFTLQLFQYSKMVCEISHDPRHVLEQFPRHLDRISSKFPGGVCLVIDRPDRCQDAESKFQWLLDPLPTGARVLISASLSDCPDSWKAWPALKLQPLDGSQVKQLLGSNSIDLDKFLIHCRHGDAADNLYVSVLDVYVKTESERGVIMSALKCKSLLGLYKFLWKRIFTWYPSNDNLKRHLSWIWASGYGMSEIDLKINPTWATWVNFVHLVTKFKILNYSSGLYTFAHSDAAEAFRSLYITDEQTIRQAVINYCLSIHTAVPRYAEELLHQVYCLGQITELQTLVLELDILHCLLSRGRVAHLLRLWHHCGGEHRVDFVNESLKVLERQEEGRKLEAAAVYVEIGKLAYSSGLFFESTSALQHALEIRSVELHPDHPLVADALYHLACTNIRWGKLAAAQTYLEQSLEILIMEYGEKHPVVAREFQAFATICHKQSRYDLADKWLARAGDIVKGLQPWAQISVRRRQLQKRTMQIESESLQSALNLSELALMHFVVGNQERSVEFKDRALKAIRNSTQNETSAQALTNLASVEIRQSDFSSADTHLREALYIRQNHGSSDSVLLPIVKKLVLTSQHMQRASEIVNFSEFLLSIQESLHGTVHTSVGITLANLAVVFCQSKRFSQAKPLLDRALDIFERCLGSVHPRTVDTLKNMALLEYELGNYETAANFYQRTMAITDQEGSASRPTSAKYE